MKHRLLALAAAGALCLSLCGFSGEQPLPDTITVQGTGLVEARPDQTEFSAGVRVTSPTAAAGKKRGKAILITEESDGVAAESDRNNPDTGGGAELMGAVEQDTAILAGTRAIQARVRVVFELV